MTDMHRDTPPVSDEGVVSHVDTDSNCVQCSYNIRGLPISGKCPECGTPVELSLRGVLLQYASTEYLDTVRAGLSLVLNGILLYIVVTILTFLGTIVFASVLGGGWSGYTLALTIVSFGVHGIILFGYWKYTEPDPGFVGRNLPDTARRVVRVAVVIQAGAAVIQLVTVLGGSAGSPAAPVVSVIAFLGGLLAFAAWIMGFFGIMRHTDWMARRIPDVFVINRIRLYIWLLPVIAVAGSIVLLLGPLIALIMYWNLLDRMRKHLKAIRATGLPAALPKRLG
ncbi:MAG: hypothetical protein IPM33_05240 [Phycisphaerales bacterium]|nr:hypothetical protein [Phycisphaerales bacterium]